MSPRDAKTTPDAGPASRRAARPPAGGRAPLSIPLRPLGSASSSAGSRARRWLGALGGLVLGGVLLVAVWGKALDPAAFAEQIHNQGLDRLLPAGAIALAALALEAGLGLALLLGVRRLWVLVPAALLVAFFVALNGRAYWLAAHGKGAEAASCGCFGNLVQRTPAEAFWQDLALLVLPLCLAFAGRDRDRHGARPRPARVRTALVLALAVAVPVFAWQAPRLPLDDLATRLKPGARVSEICAGGGGGGGGGSDSSGGGRGAVCLDTVAPELGHGDHLVVIDDMDDPALARAVRSLNAYADAPGAAEVSVLTASDAKRQRLFFWKWGPTFKIVEAPQELLRPLYRRLPRSFAVQDGRVTATFGGLPPLPARPAPPARTQR